MSRKNFGSENGVGRFRVVNSIPAYELGSFMADSVTSSATIDVGVVVVWRPPIATTCH